MGKREHEPPVRAQHVDSAREGGSRQSRQKTEGELREHKRACHLPGNACDQACDSHKAKDADRIVAAVNEGLEPAPVQDYMSYDSGKQGHPQILVRCLLHKSRSHHGYEQTREGGVHHNANPSHAARSA